jgi:hypothetical protein
MQMPTSMAIVAALAAVVLGALPGNAQTTRTWVSGVGDDGNPCSRTAQCRTFAGAIAKTAAGGEISVLDPGPNGIITINKSLAIVGLGAPGSILANNSVGVTISAGANDSVFLDGVVLEGGGSGTTGIRIISAGAVHIRNCVIRGFQAEPGLAIDIAPTGFTLVFVSNCALGKNSGGIRAAPADGGSAQVFVDDVQVENNTGSAVRVEGQRAVVRLSRSTITGNATGLDLAPGGSIISFGNNAIGGNNTDGKPSQVQPLQ